MKNYYNSDISAPSLTNSPGSLISLLDQCLVTGYGSKLPVAWTKEYHSADVAVFRTGVGSNNFYLEVDDSIAGYASIRGYRVWNVSQGENPFPRIQNSGNLYVVKSFNSSWKLYANSKIFYLIIYHNKNKEEGSGYCFGDIDSLKDPDGYQTILISRTTNDTNPLNDRFGKFSVSNEHLDGHFLASSYFQSLNPQPCGKMDKNSNDLDLINYSDNKIYIEKIKIFENQNKTIRGYLPELWRLSGNDSTVQSDFRLDKRFHRIYPDVSLLECFVCGGSKFLVEID